MTNDEICVKIARHFGLGTYGETLAQEYLDEYAHNLAEELRTGMRAPGKSYDASRWNRVVDQMADEIDPRV